MLLAFVFLIAGLGGWVAANESKEAQRLMGPPSAYSSLIAPAIMVMLLSVLPIDDTAVRAPVSYTHLTLPTILLV